MQLCLNNGKSANNSIARETQTNTSATVVNLDTTITQPKIAALSETGAVNLEVQGEYRINGVHVLVC